MNWPLLLSYMWGVVSPSSIHSGMLPGLILLRSCVGTTAAMCCGCNGCAMPRRLFQTTWVQFLALNTAWLTPVTAVTEDLTLSSGLHRHPCLYAYLLPHTNTCNQKLSKIFWKIQACLSSVFPWYYPLNSARIVCLSSTAHSQSKT